jgi:micrococcal nuclease
MTLHRAWSLPGLAGALLLVMVADDQHPIPRPLSAEALAGPVPATVERVIDGDTIEVRAHIWLGQTLAIRVRIDGVDAPEMKARCAEERTMALAARDFLEKRLAGADITLTRVVYDKYGGRVRAKIADSAGDVATALLAAGLARPYHGERREPWCTAS